MTDNQGIDVTMEDSYSNINDPPAVAEKVNVNGTNVYYSRIKTSHFLGNLMTFSILH